MPEPWTSCESEHLCMTDSLWCDQENMYLCQVWTEYRGLLCNFDWHWETSWDHVLDWFSKLETNTIIQILSDWNQEPCIAVTSNVDICKWVTLTVSCSVGHMNNKWLHDPVVEYMKGERTSRFCLVQLVLTPSQTKCTMSVLGIFKRWKQKKSSSGSGVSCSYAVIVITFSLTQISSQVLGHVDTDFYVYFVKSLSLTSGPSLSCKMPIWTIKYM